MTVYSEEIIPIPVGLGLDSYNHPANIPEGFCQQVDNFLSLQDRLVTRKGFQPTSIDTRETYLYQGRSNYYIKLPGLPDAQAPVAIMGGQSGVYAMRQFDRDDPSAETGAAIVKTDLLLCDGAVKYLNKIYINETDTIKETTWSDWNWTTGAVTTANITGAPQGKGLFAFKDRLWCWTNDKIYYTDVPASPGAYPETWATSSNFIVIGANEGLGTIHQIIPVGTKLLVFTTAGLYAVSVIGSPANWVVRTLSNSITVNSRYCAIEKDGLVFFVDTRGVWVTDGSYPKKISMAIEDVFQDRSDTVYPVYKLHSFLDGFIVSRSEWFVNGAANHITSQGRAFYTKYDFVAWSELTFGTTEQLVEIWGAIENVEVHSNWAPSNYLLLAHGVSTEASPSTAITSEILEYQGFQDVLQPVGSAAQTVDVVSTFKTKIIRGEMFKLKRAKYAYLNVSCSGATSAAMELSYAWNTETADSIESGTVTDGIIDPSEALFKIKADFQWRHLELVVTSTLSTAVQEYDILGAGLVNHTHRTTAREES